MIKTTSRGRTGPSAPSIQTRPAVFALTHRRLPTNGYGAATLVWSCLDCPAWDRLDPLPPRCPACDGEVVTVTED